MPLHARLTLGGMACLVMSAAPLAAQSGAAPDPAKLTLAREVIHVSGADSAIAHGLEMMVPAQRMANANMPPAFWDEFLKRTRSSLPQLIDSLAPMYAQHFSVDELKQLKAMYESPIGRRLVAEQPKVQSEAMRIATRWGAALGAKVATDMMDQETQKKQ